MKPERLEVYWKEQMVGFFDRKTRDVGYYTGLWVPSESELTSEFEKLLFDLKGNGDYWRGIVITYRKAGSKTRRFGLVHDFGNGVFTDAPNEMSVWRMTTDLLMRLLQSQGIVDLGSSTRPD